MRQDSWQRSRTPLPPPFARGRPDPSRDRSSDQPVSRKIRTTEPLRRIHPVWPIALVGLGYAGYFKGLSAFVDLGVDLTGLFLIVAGVGVTLHLLRRSADSRALLAVAAVWAIFTVGIANGLWTETGRLKILILVTVTVLCAIAPSALLRTQEARRYFLGATVVLAVFMAVALIADPDRNAQVQFGRLTLEGSNSVGVARVVGAGAVTALIIGLAAGRRRRWLWLCLAAALSAVTIFVGSRGPFAALVVTTTVVLLTARTFRGARRVSTLAMGVLALLALLAYVAQSENRAASRIAKLLNGGSVDENRLYLVQQSLSLIRRHPLGVGWGGFASAPSDSPAFSGAYPYPHNIFLEVLVEGGWIAGAALLVLVVLSMCGYVQQSGSAEGTALFAFAVYWVLVAQTSGDVNANRMTWIVLILGVVLAERRRRRPAHNQHSLAPSRRGPQAPAEPRIAQSEAVSGHPDRSRSGLTDT